MSRCGHHPAQAFDTEHGRKVAHQRLVCEDCRAIEAARKQFHKENHHGDRDDCPCRDEQFWIEERVPIG